MGWFNEQIQTRKQSDDEAFFEAFNDIADAVMGKALSSALKDNDFINQNAIEIILKYYHVKKPDIPRTCRDMNDQLDYMLRPNGIMRRLVKLKGDWYKDAIGAMLATRRDNGRLVAILPTGLSGYSYYEQSSEQFVKINKKNQEPFDVDAFVFYKPFPLKKLSVSALLKYIAQSLSVMDYLMLVMASLMVSLVGMFVPKISKLAFSTVVESQNVRLLIALSCFAISVSISSLMFSAIKSLLSTRINTKMSVNIQAATMMRVMSLPASFFKKYSAGDLNMRVSGLISLCNMLVSTILSTGLSSIFSLVYITQIFGYAPALVVPSLFFIVLSFVITLITVQIQMQDSKTMMEYEGQESGMSYALISAVQKIKLAGAEKRAFSRWAKLYAQYARIAYDPPAFLKLNMALSLCSTIVMYYMAVQNGMSVSDYYAFNTAYGMISGAFAALSGMAASFAGIKPVLDRVKPILETQPEVSEGKHVIDKLRGGIELSNVSFKYEDSGTNVIDKMSLKISPGQYVAIVGETACGKSTLLRLMLGLESPQKGAIYYDGKDLTTIDLRSLRLNIGVVLQNSKLFHGDIYSNITISSPWLDLQQAWTAAEIAGIADDIRAMPMGMHTIISEGSGGLSGGQKQRLMIARAVAPKPQILMLDEATSALDNLTQRKISDALAGLNCTRIVVAHRLSTIKQCDRIIYLENGHIVEDGSYDELIQHGGKFAELVARQRLD